jgi:hypothetical protein
MSLLMDALIVFLWGIASTWIFFHCWLAFLGIISGLIGIFKKSRSNMVLLAFLNYFLQLFALSGLLYLGFEQICTVYGYGCSGTETGIYWVSTTLALAFLLPQIPSKIDNIWNSTNPSTPADSA